MIKSVLFVCLGNIFRSPTAECIFREKAKISKLDISKLRARKIKIADFNEFDLLVVMDQENRSNLQKLCPEQLDKVNLLTDYSLEVLEYGYVPDPYYTRNFNQTLDIIEASLNGLIESVKNHNNK